VLTAQRTAGRSGEVLSRNELRDVQQPILNPEKAEAAGSQGVRRSGTGSSGSGFLGSLLGGTAQATVEETVEEVRAPTFCSSGGLHDWLALALLCSKT
jgi:hypothetical protein